MTDKIRKTNSTLGHCINGRIVNKSLLEKQARMVVAGREGKMEEVYRLQEEIMQSFAGRALAVRRVTTDSGKDTCGLDGVIGNTPARRYQAIEELKSIVRSKPEMYKPIGVRRVGIPKTKPGELRPLGISTMRDRAVQTLTMFALDPVAEEMSDIFSYGFRKERSTDDAIARIRNILIRGDHPEYIGDADIEKCFDKISHESIMKIVNTMANSRCTKYMQKGLVAPIHEKGCIHSPIVGTPQGGVISPLLCNLILNGLEYCVRGEDKTAPQKRKMVGMGVIRYADDFIVTSRNEKQLMEAMDRVKTFLKTRGLNISEDKSKVIKITEDKFEFLGWEISHKIRDPKKNTVKLNPTVLIIKPTIKAINKIKSEVTRCFKTDRPIESIIKELNPILRGGTNYYRSSYHSQEIFQKLSHHIYIVWKSGSDRKHRGKTRDGIHKKYIFRSVEGNRTGRIGASPNILLVDPSLTPEWKIKNMKKGLNPYLEKEYYDQRHQMFEAQKFRMAIYKQQNYKCAACKESLNNGENVELHHIIPKIKGGKYTLKNIVALHEICHKGITHAGKPIYNEEGNKESCK